MSLLLAIAIAAGALFVVGLAYVGMLLFLSWKNRNNGGM